MAAKAKWSVGNPKLEVDKVVGTFSATIPLRDDGVLQGVLRISMDANRALVVEWRGEPGAIGLHDFRAWERKD